MAGGTVTDHPMKSNFLKDFSDLMQVKLMKRISLEQWTLWDPGQNQKERNLTLQGVISFLS